MYDNEDVMELDVEEMYLSGDRIFKVLKKIPNETKVSEKIDKTDDKDLDVNSSISNLELEKTPISTSNENLEDMSLF